MAGAGRATLTWIPPGYPRFRQRRRAAGPTIRLTRLQPSRHQPTAPPGALPPVALTFRTTTNVARWQWLADKWHDVLGVDIILNPVNNPTYKEQLYLLGWCADYPGSTELAPLVAHRELLHSRIGYSNPVFDALVDQADAEVDPAARMALYQQAQTMLVGDLPVAFFYNNTNAYLVRTAGARSGDDAARQRLGRPKRPVAHHGRPVEEGVPAASDEALIRAVIPHQLLAQCPRSLRLGLGILSTRRKAG